MTGQPVELLREAAKTMRERAEAANTDKARWPYSDERIPVVPPEEWGALVDGYRVGEMGTHCASWHPAVALAVADWLDREARRVDSHAITTRKVREDWYAYQCHTCGIGGSTSKAGLATWQEAHARVRLVADDAALAVARVYLGRAES